ncbi:PblB-type antireceptor [Salmonella phage 41]|nr:PblB-type antireceptor [Salmonella phage 41]
MSLDSMLLAGNHSTPWNGVYPNQDANTLFRMFDFKTVADIIDKGPNKVTVNKNGTFTAAINPSYGPYIRMNTGNYLSWTSALLNGQSLDMTMIIGNFTYSLAASPALIDCRPVSTNGNYFVVSGKGNAPFQHHSILTLSSLRHQSY